MFEHSLYEPEEKVEPLKEGDFLAGYEIKSWQPSPRLYKILAASAAANLLALVVFAQTSILTMKGCDSPLVGSVCTVLDTVYLGAALWGTEREFIDADYERTTLEDADITFVEVAPESAKLNYPEGYFALANPEEWAAKVAAASAPLEAGYIAPGIPANIPVTQPYQSGGSLIDTPANPPKRNDAVVQGDLPTGFDSPTPSSPGINRRPRGPRGGLTKPQPSPSPEEVAEQPKVDPAPPVQDDAQPDKFGVYINKRPMKDRAKETLEQLQAEGLKLDASFKVTVEGTLGLAKDGKTIVLKNPRPIREPGVKNDPKLEKLAQDWILTVGDAGWLGYLEKIGDKKNLNKKVRVTVEQNEVELVATVRAEQSDEQVAKSLSSGLSALLSIAAPAVDGDEQLFLKATSSTSDGKTLIVNFKMPKPTVQQMIQRKLAEAKSEPKQPNSTSMSSGADNTAGR
jgi:hypothetical protein